MLSTSESTRIMTYDPYLNNNSTNNNAKVSEFLRPLPKPARYLGGELIYHQPNQQPQQRINGNINNKNQQQQQIRPKYQQQSTRPAIIEEAVNLVQKQRELTTVDDYQQRLYSYYAAAASTNTSQQQSTTTSVAPVVTPQYTPLYFNTQQYQQYYQQQINKGQSILKDNTVTSSATTTVNSASNVTTKAPFKVPTGKEGSLKHRILTRPVTTNEKRTNGSIYTSGIHFSKGSLIQLTNGELKRIEEMKVEDFVLAAERNPALRLDPSTVVRITENSQKPLECSIMLSYGRQGTQQVELEVSLEHPFFVYGKGWASLSPERSLQCYELPCHRLSVGDICISLSPRPQSKSAAESELSKKRRWSAPDQFCSDDECEQPPRTKEFKC